MVVWRYDERQECGSHEVHREEVAAVGVSAGQEEYVASLGGLSDGYLVLWHIPTRRPVCSAFLSVLLLSQGHINQSHAINHDTQNQFLYFHFNLLDIFIALDLDLSRRYTYVNRLT